jgi:hypothetical protein
MHATSDFFTSQHIKVFPPNSAAYEMLLAEVYQPGQSSFSLQNYWFHEPSGNVHLYLFHSAVLMTR